MDDNADRQPDFWLWYNGPDVEAMTPFMELVMTNPEGEVKYIPCTADFTSDFWSICITFSASMELFTGLL